MFTACYDLSRSPASYDVVAFLLHIEAERIRRKEDGIDIVITSGPVNGFRADRFWPHDPGYRQVLLDNVVIPMCHALPSVRSVTQANEAPNSFGYGRSMYGFRVMLEAIKVAGRPLRNRRDLDTGKWFWGRNYVTITLRECVHWPTRNSNVQGWVGAAKLIRTKGYEVVFIRDTAKRDEYGDVDGFVTDRNAASCDLDFRIAIYRSAFCNFFVNNGPAWVAICADAPAIIMKPTTDGLLACYTRAYFKSCGLQDQLPNCPPHQRIVWKEDERSAIMEAFESFEANSTQRMMA